MQKAFVLLSGGMDSTVCLAKALEDLRNLNATQRRDEAGLRQDIEAISIDYGQRHGKEMEYAKRTCSQLSIPHKIIKVGGALGSSMLTDSEKDVPDVDYADLPKGVSPTYVPFRNGYMLATITAYVQQWVNSHINALAANGYPEEAKADTENGDLAQIYYGAHSEDSANWAYPDCTPEFNGAMANAIYIGTYRAIRLVTPLQWLDKSEVVRLGARLGVIWSDTWSCYKGLEKHCGTCPTCRSRRTAFVKAGHIDPTEYAA